jgi:uncharacterized membrane protein YhhN
MNLVCHGFWRYAFCTEKARGMAMANVRWIWIAALVAGLSYAAATALVLSGPAVTVWKGAGVALLAVWCAMQARGMDGWLIAAVMGFGAAGDVLLETHGTIAGAIAFLLGHVVAIALYLRNRRPSLTRSQTLLAVILLPVVVYKAWSWTADGGVTAYAAFLALMAALAWTSRFPRFRTGIGAMMFVASDLLIFARMGPLAPGPSINLAVWLLYFGGQAMIASGVVRTLTTEARGNTP